jgi:Domain of unknown function (DUF222)
MSQCAPSGWLALELDHGMMDPVRLSDAELIDTVVGFERVTAWAGARQAALLAEFARRRSADYSQPTRSDSPSRGSEFAPDEVGVALRLSRTTATGRLVMAQVLVADLPGTLAAWEAGTLDVLKVRAITETSYLLTSEQGAALEARVLPRAGQQTLSQRRAALARAVLAIDPDGAEARYRERRKDRRVVVSPDEEGMASLWALLSAPDATAAYQRLCELARGLGADDSRGMDARRADLLVELLTGRRCATTGDWPTDCDRDDHNAPTSTTFPDTGATVGATDAECAGDDPAPGPAAGSGVQTSTTEGTCTESGARDTSPAGATDQDPADRGGHCCGTTHGGVGLGKPLVSVIVPITMLLGLDEQPGELVGYGPIPASLAREIAAEGTWRRLLTDPLFDQRAQPICRLPASPPAQDSRSRMGCRAAPRRSGHLHCPHRALLHQFASRVPHRYRAATRPFRQRSGLWARPARSRSPSLLRCRPPAPSSGSGAPPHGLLVGATHRRGKVSASRCAGAAACTDTDWLPPVTR